MHVCLHIHIITYMYTYVHTVRHSAYMYDAYMHPCIYVHVLLNLTINFNDRAHSVMNLWHFIAQMIFYSHMKLSDC